MNKEKQKIAIAEACGWTQIEPCTCCAGVSRGYQPTPGAHKKHLPDYLNDLNAMHEAEKTLTDEQIARWQRDLWLTCENDFYALEACAPPIVLRRFISATAAQRAEAFLRTIGKWEEAK
jgi:hypothetical protein